MTNVFRFYGKQMIQISLALAALLPASAFADEELIAVTSQQKLVGAQTINVADQLNLWRSRGMKVNSLIVVASTERGMGRLEVSAGGRAIAQHRVGTSLESIQVPVNLDDRSELRSLEIRTQGNFTIAMVGLTVEEGDFGGGGGGHRPPRPPHQPPAPPHQPPGHGGELSRAEYDALVAEMNRSAFDQGKFDVLGQYLRYWGGKMISMEQAAGILQLFTFDEKRLESLRLVRAALFFDIVRMDMVLRTFTFDSNRAKAREILLAR